MNSTEFDLETTLYLFLPGLLGLLLGLFIFQTIIRERRAPYLIATLAFGVVSGIVSILDRIDGLPAIPNAHSFALSLSLSCTGLQFLFFFLFIEELRNYHPHAGRLVIAFTLVSVQIIVLWCIYWFQGQGTVTGNLWLLADLAYGALGVFVFLGCAAPVYNQTYRLTREPRSSWLSVAVILIGAGQALGLLKDLTDFFAPPGDFKNIIGEIATYNDALALAGIILFTIVYVSNVDYIYRLPHDNFALMVSLKTGETIHFVRFKTRAKVDLNQDLLSGLLSTINSVFQSIMATSTSIKEISSRNATLLAESGRWIVATIITEKPSAILDEALNRYVDHFERMFSVRLGDKSTFVNDYDAARTLLKKIFPFFVVDDGTVDKNSHPAE
ncbi:MAG: hypothetical protein GYA24_09780 [Candidatus Lokiarchaeota archaeon]|nr:hypothetical protein [Candidatus Lokiarchaeota archaeon]